MADIHNLRRMFLKRLSSKSRTYVGIVSDSLGRISGTTESAWVPDNAGYVYVNMMNGQVLEIYKGNIDNPIIGQLVRLGRMPNSVRYQIEGQWDVYASANIGGELKPPHNHTYPSPQTTWVRREQVLVWNVLPSEDDPYTIVVYGGVAFIGAGWVGENDVPIDLEPSKPSQGARWVLVQLEANGTFTLKNGSIVADKLALLVADIPIPDADTFPIAAVRMYDGQTVISIAEMDTDIVMLGWSAGYSLGNILSGDIMYKADYDTNADGEVNVAELAHDSELLDGLDSLAFMRKSVYDTTGNGLYYLNLIPVVYSADFDFLRLADGTPVFVRQRILND